MSYYETERLILRKWQESDIVHFIALNQDPDVMEFLIVRNEDETIFLVQEFMQHLYQYGYTMYACILKSSMQFIGFVGLWHRFDMSFSPCVEIGWRLDKKYWKQGLATEAAHKCLEIGFVQFDLDEIVAFTAQINKPSERVMQKLGMEYVEDFEHYKLPDDHNLKPHILYKLSSDKYLIHQKHIGSI